MADLIWAARWGAALPALGAGLVIAGSALAVEPTGNPVADAFIAAHESERGRVLDVGMVSESGGTVTISSMSSEIDVPATEGDTDVPFEIAGQIRNDYSDVVIRNGAVEGGVLVADEISIATTKSDMTPIVFSGGPFRMSDVRLSPGDMGGSSSLTAVSYADEISWSDVEVSVAGARFADVAAVLATNEGDPETQLRAEATVEGIRIETGNFPPEVTGILAALDLLDATSSVEFRLQVNGEAKTMAVESMRLSVEDGASLDMSVAVSNVDVARAFAALMNTEDPDALADGFAGATLSGFGVALTDNGLRARGLALASAMMSTSEEGLQSMATFAVAGGLASVGLNDLANEASSAVTEFLQNGGTIRGSAEPTEPVGAEQVQALAAENAPAALVELLNVSVGVD